MNSKVLYKLSYGLYVISSINGTQSNGQIANTVFQISSEPLTIAVSINKKNLTHEYIEKSGVFSVSVLPVTTPVDFIGQFGFKSGRDVDKFAGVAYRTGLTGVPILLENSIGYLEANVVQHLDVATHTLFIGEVVEAEVLGETEPMTYAYYQAVKRGSVPPAAPTYIKPQTMPTGAEGEKHKCTVCGYIYNSAQGDPASGQAAGTLFSALPEAWVCPVCGAGKEEFEALP
ncbi:flavin reductase [Paradesulfitobacterium aromaticivorans]